MVFIGTSTQSVVRRNNLKEIRTNTISAEVFVCERCNVVCKTEKLKCEVKRLLGLNFSTDMQRTIILNQMLTLLREFGAESTIFPVRIHFPHLQIYHSFAHLILLLHLGRCSSLVLSHYFSSLKSFYFHSVTAHSSSRGRCPHALHCGYVKIRDIVTHGRSEIDIDNIIHLLYELWCKVTVRMLLGLFIFAVRYR